MTTDLDPTRVDRGAESETALSPRRERTRERLLDAAYGLFAEHGINGTSIEAVCEAAGFTRGAFYSNFDTKESLFLALTEREIRMRMRSLEAAVEHLPDDPVRDGVIAPEAIATIVAAVMADPRDERRWCLMSAELELLALRDPQVAERFADQEESFRTELRGHPRARAHERRDAFRDRRRRGHARAHQRLHVRGQGRVPRPRRRRRRAARAGRGLAARARRPARRAGPRRGLTPHPRRAATLWVAHVTLAV